MYSGCQCFVRYMYCKYCLPVCGLPINFSTMSFYEQKFLILAEFILSIFFFLVSTMLLFKNFLFFLQRYFLIIISSIFLFVVLYLISQSLNEKIYVFTFKNKNLSFFFLILLFPFSLIYFCLIELLIIFFSTHVTLEVSWYFFLLLFAILLISNLHN